MDLYFSEKLENLFTFLTSKMRVVGNSSRFSLVRETSTNISQYTHPECFKIVNKCSEQFCLITCISIIRCMREKYEKKLCTSVKQVKQECIPVGCLPPVAVAVPGGLHQPPPPWADQPPGRSTSPWEEVPPQEEAPLWEEAPPLLTESQTPVKI